MHTSMYSLTVVLLISLLSMARAHMDDNAPRDPDVSASYASLKPHVGNTLSSGNNHMRRGLLVGLLAARQSCQSGYGACNTGGCCPLGGSCCTTYCCDVGYWCYSTGCCQTNENGCEGNSCCTKGMSCCKGGGCCDASDYCAVSASGETGCCPIGKICTGTVPPPLTLPPPPPPPPTTISTTTSLSTKASTSFSTSTSTSTRTTTSTSTIAAGGNENIPDAKPGTQNVIISAIDTRITWVGSWTYTFSTCGSSEKSLTASSEITSANQTLTFTFNEGSAIYLSVATYNVRYRVTFLGQSTIYGSTQAEPNCTIGWSNTNFAQPASGKLVATAGKSVVIEVLGPTVVEENTHWSFEFNNFALTLPTGGGGGGDGTNTSISHPSITPFDPSASPRGFEASIMGCGGLAILALVYGLVVPLL